MKYFVLDKSGCVASIVKNEDNFILSNGIVERIINVNTGTISYKNLYLDYQINNGNSKEAIIGISNNDYTIPGDFKFSSYKIVDEIYPLVSLDKSMEVPKGRTLELTYVPSPSLTGALQNINVIIRYEIYDSLPLISKKLYVVNNNTKNFILSKVISEILDISSEKKDMFYFETNFNGMNSLSKDNSKFYNNNILNIAFDNGPYSEVLSGGIFEGFVIFEILHCSEYTYAKTNEIKEVYRNIAPWTLENPLVLCIPDNNTENIKNAVLHAKEAGFDTVIHGFLNYFDFQKLNDKQLNTYKEIYSFAKKNDIKLGFFASLGNTYTKLNKKPTKSFVSNIENSYVNGRDIRTLFTFVKNYILKLNSFIELCGAQVIYISDVKNFIGGNFYNHTDLEDVTYTQWKVLNNNFFKELKNKNISIYSDVDFYLNGVSKTSTGLGNDLLSEDINEQIKNIRNYGYKNRNLKLSSMLFTPVILNNLISENKNSTFEPLEQKFDLFLKSLTSSVLLGISPFVFGTRLFYNKESKELLLSVVKIFKELNELLNSNSVTLNFYDGEDLDYSVSAHNKGFNRGIISIFNNTDKNINKVIKVPLYYTGLTERKDPPYIPFKNIKLNKYETTKQFSFGSNNSLTYNHIEEIKNIKEYNTGKKYYYFSLFNLLHEAVFADEAGFVNLEVFVPKNSFVWYLIKKS